MAAAGHAANLVVEQHLHVRSLLDPTGQVSGHVRVEIIAADHEVHPSRHPGEEDDGLTSGVAATDHHHVRLAAERGLGQGGRVVDATALEPLAPFRGQTAVVGSGGDEKALGGDRLAAVEPEDRVRALEGQGRHRRRDGQARPELAGLHHRPLGQLGAAHAGGKPKIVLDAHAATGLAAGPGALEHRRVEALGRRIDRRAQSGRTGSDHDEVVERVLERPPDPERLGQLPIRGIAQDELAPGHHRRLGLAHPEPLQQLVHLRVGLQVEPGERHPVPREEVEDAQGVARVARADHPRSGEVLRLPQQLPSSDEGL